MSVRIALVLPDVLGTYGDRGNATVLAQRLRWRGIEVEVVEITGRAAVPDSCDIYVLGGGEDAAQLVAVEWLRAHRGMQRAVARGAVALGVCAGLQILGMEFSGIEGVPLRGLEMLDVTTRALPVRATGELVVRPNPQYGDALMTGFENHRGGTRLGPGVSPLGYVYGGVGNGVDRQEGAVQGRIIGTYMHGPVLARNPQLADLLLSWAMGIGLPPLDVPAVRQLHEERIRARSRSSGVSRGSRRYRPLVA